MDNKNSGIHKFHYFSKHPSRMLIGLYSSVGLMGLGMAAVSIFEPIYLYTLGYSLKEIMFFYLLVYLLYSLILPWFGKIIGRLGLEHSIFYSQFFLISYYVCLFAISRVPVFFFIAPIFFAIQKSLYWPAYHADFALFSSDKQRGREVSGLETLNLVVYIIGPLLGGLIIVWSNFSTLFIVVSILFLLSTIPLLRIKEIHSQQPYKYIDVIKTLFDRDHRRNLFAYLGFGEELIVLTIWPIFIYTIISNYASIGQIVAGATLITGLTVLFLGKLADKYNNIKFLRWGSLTYFFSWLMRAVATLGWHVLIFDTISRFAKEMVYIPLQSMTYKTAKKYGALSYGIYLEQSVAIAKVLVAVSAIIIIIFFTNPWFPLFILAAGFSLFYMIYQKKY